MRLGLAVRWTADRERTWSGTPAQLREALSARAEVVDLAVQPARAERWLARRVHGDAWAVARSTELATQARLALGERRHAPDVVVSMGDLGTTRAPLYTYQDLSWSLVRRHLDEHGPRGLGIHPASARRVEQLARRQRDVYDRSAGLFVFSRWLRDSLVQDGITPEKVHVVGAGAGAAARASRPTAAGARTARLLFVGRAFERKGGPEVVEAFRQLRAEGRDAELVVAGPETWPLAGSPPSGVRFLGRVELARVGALMRDARALVVPSRFEAYGMVFVEALALGLPVVARAVCAVPELVSDGRDGLLVARDADVPEIADAMRRVLDDDSLVAGAQAGADAIAARCSWSAVAERMLEVVRG